MRRVVTQDATWVHHFDPDAKKQSMQWKHTGSPFKRVSSVWKGMTSILCDSQGVIIVDCLEEGHMINGVFYAEMLKRLRQEIVNK